MQIWLSTLFKNDSLRSIRQNSSPVRLYILLRASQKFQFDFEVCLQADDDSDSDSDTEMVCPVCNAALYNVSLMVFNQHVDTCLNRQTIRQLIHEQDGEGAKRYVLSQFSQTSSCRSSKNKRIGVFRVQRSKFGRTRKCPDRTSVTCVHFSSAGSSHRCYR